MRSRAIFLVGVLTVVGLMGGVAASSVSAATKTTVTWKVSSLTAGQVKSLSAIATSNSSGLKTWSKTGSCVLSPKSKTPKLTMGAGASCTLTLKIAKSGKFPAKTSTKIITRKSTTTTTTIAPTTTTTTSTTLAPVPLYSVGAPGPGGGTIFYVDMRRAVGSRYLEVACAGWQNTCDGSADPQVAWDCHGTPINGADGTAIGTGELNTTDIVTGCPTTGIAAKVADAYSNNTLDDWFLPSLDELNALCNWAYVDAVGAFCNENGAGSLSLTYGGFSAGGYWSSSESDGYNAWAKYFNSGQSAFTDKYVNLFVRPIRSM